MNASILLQARGDDVGLVFLEGREVAGGKAPQMGFHLVVKALRLGDAAADDDAGGAGDGEEGEGALGEIPGFHVPGGMICREFVTGCSPAFGNGRTGGETFQAG